jgi:hypothetical protein
MSLVLRKLEQRGSRALPSTTTTLRIALNKLATDMLLSEDERLDFTMSNSPEF